MEKLNIKTNQLMPSRTVFHGIVPGLSFSPIGKIKIDVLFGDKDHFRREAIWFEVVDLESPYHTLLGRPALAQSMAVPHYAYLKMKMPRSKGIRQRDRTPVECKSSSKILQLMQYVSHYPFVLKY